MTARLVVLRALGLGDLLTGLPALRAIADAFPEHEKLLAAPSPLAPLVDLAELPFAISDHSGLAPLPAALRRTDVAVNLHGRGPQSTALLRALQPGRLVAFGSGSHEGPRWRAGEHEVERWCRMLAEHGIAADPRRIDLRAPGIEVDDGARGATLLHPGASSAARRWPAARWAAVARAEREAGRSVVVTGSAAEAPLARRIACDAGLAPSAARAGETDLLGLAAHVAAAGRVVCGDTGVAHLATALGTPSVILFGPISPIEWGPPACRPRHRVLWSGSCGDPHAEEADPGLLRIGPEQVLAELHGLHDAA
ncbi:MAG: glycosyltransferase family 9 protein [Actinobacteria bacterium]|nr:glycosyltransferase family 9 protein [Actinomycetota bacterium]